MNAPLSSTLDVARELAAALAHRGCCGTEHDPANGKLHGCCVVCGVPWPCETAKYYLRQSDEKEAAPADNLRAILEDLEGAFDEQTYREKVNEDFDAPDDREYSVNISAGMLRRISRALTEASRQPAPETAAVINLDEPIPAACKCHYQSTPNMFHMAYAADCPLHGGRMRWLSNAQETTPSHGP